MPRRSSSRDAADALLGWAVRVLPPAERREWGQAMRAELAHLGDAGERRRFALGCLRGALTRPAPAAGIGYRALMLGAVAGIIVWTAGVTYTPLRIGLVAMVALPVALAWLARRRLPVGRAPAERLLRAAGYALVAACATLLVAEWRTATVRLDDKAGAGAPIYTAALIAYTLAIILVTRIGSREVTRALTTGAVCGAVVGMACLAVVLVRPPLSPSNAWVLAAMSAAGVVAARIHARTAGPDSSRRDMVAVLCAITVVALLVFVYADGLLQFFPRWVPDTSPANVPFADRLANNRAGAEDPYFGVLVLGCLAAVAMAAAAWRSVAQGPFLDRNQVHS